MAKKTTTNSEATGSSTSEPNKGNGKGKTRDGAELLLAAIASRGWTQLRAASEIGVSTTTMSRWLSKKRVPDRKHMAILREKFGIRPQVWV